MRIYGFVKEEPEAERLEVLARHIIALSESRKTAAPLSSLIAGAQNTRGCRFQILGR